MYGLLVGCNIIKLQPDQAESLMHQTSQGIFPLPDDTAVPQEPPSHTPEESKSGPDKHLGGGMISYSDAGPHDRRSPDYCAQSQ